LRAVFWHAPGQLVNLPSAASCFAPPATLAPPHNGATHQHAYQNADEDDDDGEGISVFAYTRAPVRSAEDEDEFDRDDIKAAVMRLRKEERTPEQPISKWRDDE